MSRVGFRLERFAAACVLATLCSFPLSAQEAGMPQPSSADWMAGFDSGAGVARLSDSDASCEQLFAEAGHLEARVAAMPRAEDPMQASARMQEEMMAAQKKMMGGQRAKGLASSLLSMVPGVGGLAGSVAAGAMSRGPDMDAINEASRKAMADMQKSTQAMVAVAQLQQRREHVTGLFLSRGCKASTLDTDAVARAQAQLAEAPAEGAASGASQ